jgi:hypothetical protein
LPRQFGQTAGKTFAQGSLTFIGDSFSAITPDAKSNTDAKPKRKISGPAASPASMTRFPSEF